MTDIHHPIPNIRELGADLLCLPLWQRALTIAYPFFWCGAYLLFAAFEYWFLAATCLVCLSFISYGSTSHDLVHRNLGLSKKANDVLLCLVELLAFRSGHAYQAAHLHHHARYPHPDDVEGAAARMSFLGALADGFIFQLRIWLWARRNVVHHRKWIICEGIAALALMTAAAFSFVPMLQLYLLLMIMGSWVIPLITSYLPHDVNGEGELFQTRAFRGKVASILAMDHLYHLEHHLFPAVPHANWPKLARRLDPHLARAGVKATVFWF